MAKHAKTKSTEDQESSMQNTPPEELEDYNNIELDDELVELEFDEESVAYYIEDQDGNEIGVALYEDGAEVEYMYDRSEVLQVESVSVDSLKISTDNLVISEQTKENLIQVRDDLVSITKEGAAIQQELKKTSDELKEAYDDILNSFKFLKRKPR